MTEAREEWITCGCGHTAIQHHGVDPADGCMVVGMRGNPDWCPCSMTCPEVVAAWDEMPEMALTPAGLRGEACGDE